MATPEKISEINVTISRELLSPLSSELQKAGVMALTVSSGRRILLQERRGVAKIFGEKRLFDDPIQTVSFLVPSEMEFDAVNFVAQKADLFLPGRGSVYSRPLEVLGSHNLCSFSRSLNFPSSANRILPQELTGICCIVQKGFGDAIGRLGLDTGTAVPAITFGEGTGLRDKLGLWRITIPAEKEVITLVVASSEATDLIELMIDRGNLDRPGMGFIFSYMVGKGVLNTKFSVGGNRQAASIEQIISAIDDIKGTTDWRRRDLSSDSRMVKERRYLHNLVNMTLVCDEGYAWDLTAAAMSSGAAGATISKMRHIAMGDNTSHAISPAREVSEMVVSKNQVEPIVTALVESGAFGDNAHGLLLAAPVDRACTYLGSAQ